ncbi:MAG: hypothetical protein HQK56_03045 [Deltaproteobacteria bacterium]|nr:hypothetical protein [Deltaproteobacteria bacterium]
MKNLKLSLRIGLGFGVLIAITLVLGIMASWNMNTVGRQSTELAQQFVPEAVVAGEVENRYLEVMLGVRGYAFTQNENYLKEGMAALEKVKKALENGKSLVQKYPRLEKLKEGVIKAEEKVKNYALLIDETVSANKNIGELRQRANAAAKKFTDNCLAYENMQRTSFDKEIRAAESPAKLLERNQKVNDINDIIEAGYEVRTANLKAQATNNLQFTEEALKHFQTIYKGLDEMKAATHREENLQLLSAARTGAEEYEATITEYVKTWQALDSLNKKTQ